FLFQWSPPENVERDLTPGNSVLRLSSSNATLRNEPDFDYDSTFKAWKKAGWTACETWSNHWLSRKMSDSETRELKQTLKDNDMVFYGIHAAGNIIAPGEAGEASRRHIVETIHAAADMDCKLVLTHAGSLNPSRDAAHPQNWSKSAWEQSVAALKSICSDTAGIDVQIPIEAVNSESVNNPWAHKRLIE
ncbi:MAG: TIM barrel protein, partial [Pseudomonadales bacterium]